METWESYKKTPKKDGQDAEEKNIRIDLFGQKADKDSLPIEPSKNSASNGMKTRPTKNNGPDAEAKSILPKAKNAEQKSGKDLAFRGQLPNSSTNGDRPGEDFKLSPTVHHIPGLPNNEKKQPEQFQPIPPEKDPKKPVVKELPNAVKSEKGDKEEYQIRPEKEHKA